MHLVQEHFVVVPMLNLGHSKMKHSNFIGYLHVSKFCRSLVHVSIDLCLWGNTKHGNYMPVTLTMHRHLTGQQVLLQLTGRCIGLVSTMNAIFLKPHVQAQSGMEASWVTTQHTTMYLDAFAKQL